MSPEVYLVKPLFYRHSGKAGEKKNKAAPKGYIVTCLFAGITHRRYRGLLKIEHTHQGRSHKRPYRGAKFI